MTALLRVRGSEAGLAEVFAARDWAAMLTTMSYCLLVGGWVGIQWSEHVIFTGCFNGREKRRGHARGLRDGS